MEMVLDSVCDGHLAALHFASDYVPKRAVNFFLSGTEERIAALVSEMEAVVECPGEYAEGGSCLLYFGFMILAALRREEGIALVRKMGLLDVEWIEALLGDHFFDSYPLAIAELYQHSIQDLKTLIEDSAIDPFLRAAALQSMMILFGQKGLSRTEIVSYFKHLLETRREKIPYLYDVIAGASMALHPEELIIPLRAAYGEGFIDPEHVQLKEIEEVLALPKDAVVEESREMFAVDLKNLIAHLELAYREIEGPERNDTCPCGSGAKFKKCCQ